nr:DUF3375 domain-containing protein [Methylobacterium sp. OTU13CASTA1]
MPSAAGLDPARRRRELLQARAEIDRELAQIEAGTPLRPASTGQDGQGWGPDDSVTLKQAAGLWGVGYEAARQRAETMVPLGLAVKLRPGGWRVRIGALS